MVQSPDAIPPIPGGQGPQPSKEEPSSSMYSTPFMKMFPSGASQKDLQAFLNNFLKMMIFEFKQSDDAWKRGQDELKKVSEGDE